MNFLELDAISKRFSGVLALDGVSLAVPQGSRTAIVGPSGSGKTTLLRIIAGFEVADTGRVSLDGVVMADGSRALPAHRRGIGFVPQDGALFPHLSIAENIGFGLARHIPDRAKRIEELIGMVALDKSLLVRRPHELSGGQQQRIALARALAQQPKLMLLDEPFSALDTGLRASTRKATADVLRAAGITTILVTHDQGEALSFADLVAVMREGRVAQAGTPRDVYLRPVDSGVAAFLGEAVILPAEISGGMALCQLGHLRVDDPSASRVGQIMLRPEQILLRKIAPGDVSATGCLGEVQDVDFGGSSSLVNVRILPCFGTAPGIAGPVSVRAASHGLPYPGDMVEISVVGAGHVFGAGRV